MTRALYIHAAHDARVAPFNLREGRPGETLLEVASVGLCGSDLHYYKDGGIGSAHWWRWTRTSPVAIAPIAMPAMRICARMWSSSARRLSTGR